jgi:PPE-repeat protein
MQSLTLPPEITSALIHSGPGAEPLLEAAAAWQLLGTSLEESASSSSSVLSSLAGAWHGPAAVAMIEAVEAYLAWMRATAQQCLQIAASADAAAAAFTSTRAAVVPVATVTANRTRLVQLWATNRFGSNLPAIAQTEAQYQSMWANNSAAMIRYQAAAQQATTLPLFVTPPSVTDPTGVAAQDGAVSTAQAVSPAAKAAASPITNLAFAPAAVAADPVNLGFADPTTGYFGLANQYANQFISSGFPINLLSYLAQNTSAQALQTVGGDVGTGLSEGLQSVGGSVSSGLGNLGAFGAAGLSAETTAAMGAGVHIGQLTAPPAVVGLLPATASTPVQLAAATTPLPTAEAGMPMLPPLMPPPISAGSGWRKRKSQKYEDLAIGKELKGTWMPRPPSAG